MRSRFKLDALEKSSTNTTTTKKELKAREKQAEKVIIVFKLIEQAEYIFGSFQQFTGFINDLTLIAENQLNFFLVGFIVESFKEHNVFEYSESVVDSELKWICEGIHDVASGDEEYQESEEGSKIEMKSFEENGVR